MKHLPKLNPADSAWLADTMARNRAKFAGWTMETDDDAEGDDTGGDDSGADDSDKGYPPNTAVAEMTPAQQAAYWRDKSQTHESRNKELLKLTGGKYGDALKADLDELETLRAAGRTDGERAIEEARSTTRTEVRTELGRDAARVALEFALGHDPETNDQSTLIESLDLTKVLTDDGKVDTAKVKALAAQIAPADKDKRTPADYGGGKRKSSETTGVKAGAALFDSRRKKSTTTGS